MAENPLGRVKARNRATWCSFAVAIGASMLLLAAVPGYSQQSGVTAPRGGQAVAGASNVYPLGPDSIPQAGVRQGATFTFTMAESKIFPGTHRKIEVYVPAEYDPGQPACVYVGLDGLSFNTATVFDNLIAQHAMPVTIAIGVAPGVVSAAGTAEDPRFDRSLEFDTRSGRLGRFLLEEVLPAVERQTTPSGAAIHLSHNPNDRAIGGASTGGIGAFTVAWEHPDAFRRVFTAIGTFVGMRGGEQYYVSVRKTEPKPIRIFMQDGAFDEWGGGPEIGDWWMSNQTMERALSFAGYDVRHEWGTGTHSPAHATALFPEVMRWLWRDYPAPVTAQKPGNPVLKAVLLPGENWQVVAEGCATDPQLQADAKGQLFYSTKDAPGVRMLGRSGEKGCQSASQAAFAFGSGGERYQANEHGGISVFQGEQRQTNVLAAGLQVRGLTLDGRGNLFAVGQARDGGSELWRVRKSGEATKLAGGLLDASSVALLPDGRWAFVAQQSSHMGLSYRVNEDATFEVGEPLYSFAVPGSTDTSAARSVAFDRDGRAYVATSLGVQIFDRNGRVTAILPLPGDAPAVGLSFGGEDFGSLFVSGGGRVYARRLNVRGLPPASPPIKLPPWTAG